MSPANLLVQTLPMLSLDEFLKPFPPDVQKTALALRTWISARYPDSYELVYDNYNALAIGFGLSEVQTDVFVSFAVYAKYVNLGFNRGK